MQHDDVDQLEIRVKEGDPAAVGVEAMVLDALRANSTTPDTPRRAPCRQQIREADEAIERANADLDNTIR